MVKEKFLLYFVFACAIPALSYSQKKITREQQVWLGYFNQSRFSKKWGLWTDFHLRTKEDFVNQFSQAVVRGGITYYLNDVTKITVGDSYIWHFPADNHKAVTQPEHRPWQQLQWHTTYPRTRTMQWLRLEERFRRNVVNDSTLGEENNFNFRIRYNFLLQVPLTKTKVKAGDFSFILNNEIHINFGEKIVYNTFDQNRFFAGFAYHVNSHDNLQFGYMNLFQQQASGSSYRYLHVARVFYFHNMDWRSGK